MFDGETLGTADAAALGASGAVGGGADPPRGWNVMPAAGEAVGRYRLVRLLGQGGFGSVFEAEQTEPVRRRVALKIIRPGMGSSEVVARFDTERQVLALMDHPCIARVLDAGATGAGLPFFVMELVAGEPITGYCERRGLGLPARLALFSRVCDAVQHAHLRGVIHRDLKPSNVLAFDDPEGRPAPKVIDFGIAKALAAGGSGLAGVTLTGEHRVLGTPEYMSPEQAELGAAAIDTRSDVYSLGVILYELLTGERPHDLSTVSFYDLGKFLRNVSPQRPSVKVGSRTPRGGASRGAGGVPAAFGRDAAMEARRRRLRGDLDWVCMKALERDRARRYQSAGELAEDLRRYERDEPVSAGPPTAGYVLRKFVVRHRAAVATAGALAAVVGLGVLGTATFAVRAELARAEAQSRGDRLDRVVKFQADTLRRIDRAAMGRSLERDLASMLRENGASEQTLRELAGAMNGTTLAASLLDEHVFAAARRAVAQRFADDPASAAPLLATIAEGYLGLGLADKAEEPARAALAAVVATQGADSEDGVASLSVLGVVLRDQERLAEARAVYREARERSSRVYGPRHHETMLLVDNLAVAAHADGAIAEAISLHREALSVFERSPGEKDAVTLRCRANLASSLLRTRDPRDAAEALAIYQEIVPVGEASLGADDDSVRTWRGNLATALHETGDYAAAAELGERVVESHRRLDGDNHPDTLLAMGNLAATYQRVPDLPRAAALYEGAVRRAEASLPEDHWITLFLLGNYAEIVERQGRLDEAEAMYRRVIAALERRSGPQNPEAIISRNNLGVMFREAKQFERAEAETLIAVRHAQEGAEVPAAIRRHVTVRLIDVYKAWLAAVGSEGEAAVGIRAKMATWEGALVALDEAAAAAEAASEGEAGDADEAGEEGGAGGAAP